MKQILLALVCFFSVQAMAWTDEDKPITVSQLPQTAQQFIKKHFASHKVALAKMDHDIFNKSYDVIFTNGDKIEFEGNGKWSEVKCPKNGVPGAIVPEQIKNYVQNHYKGTKILSIEKDKTTYEVKLSNNFELKFNKAFKLMDIDR